MMVETVPGPADVTTQPLAPRLELQGAFDVRAARSALETLRRYTGTEAVLVDFSKVNSFQDCALDLFTRELSQLPELRLQTRGLPGHPARILQYLRIDPRTLAPLRMSRRLPVVRSPWDDHDFDD
ncbi:MAG TPA: STAS domain-containing protein [Archangium sp.]|uniref:STAS domain-containing protein n=1 Tax=Archangium sp. TaxID=1872627 RepID=UPI002E2FC2B5|nr:STAS domain-containing protein [Archangium sp.]HEX5746182.1 STAS domain-containing protein [Archangium sp.]